MIKLQWDSDFWGIDIFHFDKSKGFDKDEITGKLALVQALPNVSDLDFIHELEQNGFKFKECKITLKKNKFYKHKIDNSSFRTLTVNDLQPYKKMLYELFGNNSRYDIFADDKVNFFYYTWLVNSIDGKMDDECIGHFIGDKMTGFVTYRLQGSEMSIGLFGVLPEFQGQEISQLILSYIDEIAMNNNVNKVIVATQGTNTKAINAYIKNGYNIYSIDHWYYFMKGVKNDSV